jgi:glucosyl-3-phosphoglycerate synthase
LIRSLDHADFPREALLAAKDRPVSVVLPARDCADTVGSVVERIAALGGLVDQILVVDGDSSDGTAEVAAAAGAQVALESQLMPAEGPVLGKGDAMWRALGAVTGEVVAYIDADTRDFDARFVSGLVGPLLTDPGLRFVKATYRRPFTAGEVEVPGGGGRVSQLMARPLLAAFYPELAPLTQPLAGEFAATRELLERIPFATGYAVEMAMLLDVHELAGAAAMAQSDLGERRNRHQPLDALRPMAETVLAVVCGRQGLETAGPAIVTRPPRAR